MPAGTKIAARTFQELSTLHYDTTSLTVPYGLPTIVCLCGSTRFAEAYKKAMIEGTLKGKIVLSIGVDMRTDMEYFNGMEDEQLDVIKDNLDMLHLYKIALADEILVLNVNGYIGTSTQREISYAKRLGKKIHFLEGI